MKERLEKLKSILTSRRSDAILISDPSNIYYISAFSGTDSYCLVTRSESYIITDFRYQEQARKEAAGFAMTFYITLSCLLC